MTRHVAFLRAVNTTGRRVKNSRLSEIVLSLGASNAQGFIASGNVIFDTETVVDEAFVETLEDAFLASYGFEIPTVVRSADEVLAVAAHRPFDGGAVEGATGRPYVGFMRAAPPTDVVQKIEAMATLTDRLAVHNRELHWLPESGEFQSDISIPAIERLTGTMTVRVMTTVDRIVSKFLT